MPYKIDRARLSGLVVGEAQAALAQMELILFTGEQVAAMGFPPWFIHVQPPAWDGRVYYSTDTQPRLLAVLRDVLDAATPSHDVTRVGRNNDGDIEPEDL